MPGQAIVTIGDNQWSVELADTTDELIAGLAGRESINPGTGMLFTLPSRQAVTVTTAEMLFPMDVVFISDDAVIDIARDVQPGYEVDEATPCDGFLEVNAGEAFSVEVGDAVATEVTSTGGFDVSQIISFAIPLTTLGFATGMAGIMLGSTGSSSHSSSGHPSSESEATFPPEAKKDITFCKHMWELEKTMGRSLTREEVAEKWENWKKLRYRPKTEEERRLSHSLKYGTEELPERGKGLITPTYENLAEGQTLVDEAGDRWTIINIKKEGVPAKWAYTIKGQTIDLTRTRALGEIERYYKIEHHSIEEHELTPRAIKEGTHPYHPPAGIPAKVWPVRAPTGEGYSLYDRTEGVWFGRRRETYQEAVEAADRENRRLWEAGRALRGESGQSVEARFIGACKVVDGLCHTHGYSVSKAVKCPESPLTDEEWAAAWELAETAYPEGMSNPWVNGWWPETLEEAEKTAMAYAHKMKDAVRMFREKQAKAMENYERGADKAIYNYRRYVIAEYETGKEIGVVPGPAEHHSMWLSPRQRKECEAAYGAVACRWGEELAAVGDFETVKRAAKAFYSKMKEAVGIA